MLSCNEKTGTDFSGIYTKNIYFLTKYFINVHWMCAKMRILDSNIASTHKGYTVFFYDIEF